MRASFTNGLGNRLQEAMERERETALAREMLAMDKRQEKVDNDSVQMHEFRLPLTSNHTNSYVNSNTTNVEPVPRPVVDYNMPPQYQYKYVDRVDTKRL